MELLPIQVKQSERVGRNVVDNFETAVERSGKHMGFIVAFSFTRNAYEEAAAAKQRGRPHIVLVRVADVVKIGELVDSANLAQLADLAEEIKQVRTPTPDLMRLFGGLRQSRRKRDFPWPSEAKAPAAELVKSA